MTNTNISFNNEPPSPAYFAAIPQYYRGSFIDRPLAILLLIILTPCLIINLAMALIAQHQLFSFCHQVDALNRSLIIRRYKVGFLKNTAVLFDIVLGKIGFCGIPITHRLDKPTLDEINHKIQVKAGIFSLYDLHRKTGLTVTNKEQLLAQQLQGGFIDYLILVLKSVLCLAVYGQHSQELKTSKVLPLFGLTLLNTNMKTAVQWVSNVKPVHLNTKIGFFVNVHSINLSIKDRQFFNSLSKADALLADGSGMRIAATKAGYQLKGNNNGTDMLPHLCKSAIKNSQSLYFLGARPGIADKAANNLQAQFPSLTIAGTQHGYSNLTDEQIIEQINQSHCDVLLVAMGSPLQEHWLIKNKDKLQCNTALAVGGLFDFYSGAISRSPLWLRELGLEWVWRLIQEPRSKFSRYVIGNPLFLYRTFFLNLVSTGEK